MQQTIDRIGLHGAVELEHNEPLGIRLLLVRDSQNPLLPFSPVTDMILPVSANMLFIERLD